MQIVHINKKKDFILKFPVLTPIYLIRGYDQKFQMGMLSEDLEQNFAAFLFTIYLRDFPNWKMQTTTVNERAVSRL